MSHQTSVLATADRLVIHNLVHADARAAFESDVHRGLSNTPKQLPPKYFYDELGSHLFEAICLLPEYYPTRAENEILERYSDDIVSAFDGPKTLLEMGSGSATKTRCLIEAVLKQQSELLYVPVDISASALETSSRVLLQSFPGLRIEAYAGEYFDGLAALASRPQGTRTLALFLGSNIGNFDAGESRTFLRAMRKVLRVGDALLLGADLKKDVGALEAAYNDALGVTAAFNLNLLVRINRELDADFDVRFFKHEVDYNEEVGRVETHIVSTRTQTIHVRGLDLEVQFLEGERMHTENSYKYDLDGLSRIAVETGFVRTHTWLDEREQFSSNLFLASSDGELS